MFQLILSRESAGFFNLKITISHQVMNTDPSVYLGKRKYTKPAHQGLESDYLTQILL